MVHVRPLSALCGLLALCSVGTLRAKADNATLSGVFTNDNQVLAIPITTTTTQSYDFYTTSYSGGVNADGTTTTAGGFDPILSLFDSNGNIVPGGGASSGGADANLEDVLGPGMYTLTLTEFGNSSNDNTINGFTTDVPSFVASVCTNGPSAAFTDAYDCTTRNGNYTVNYTSSSVTPEPPSALLVLLPLAGVVLLNRRRLASLASL